MNTPPIFSKAQRITLEIIMLRRTTLALSVGAIALIGCNDESPSVAAGDVGVEDTRRVGGDTATDAVLDIGIDTGSDVEEDGPVRVDLGMPDTSTEDAETDVPTPDPDPEPECGNGIRETGEVCDGDDIIFGVECTDEPGYIGGELSCSEDCTLDFSSCLDAICGDELVTGAEDCEAEVDEATDCGSLGFAPGGDGVVTCTDECAFDTSECVDTICGNDHVEEGFETCDGTAFGDDSCRVRGFFGGELSCSEDCGVTDESGCVDHICGNGTVEGPEECDGPGSVAVSCVDVDEIYVGGALGCSEDCLAFVVDDCLLDEISPDVDTDEDGVTDDVDNCIGDPNPNQLDYDADGVGNVCDEAIVFDVLVEAEGTNTFATSIGGEIPLLGEVALDVDLLVETASIGVLFDDEGVMTSTATIGFADTSEEFDLGGIGLPIPGFESIAVDVTALVAEALTPIVTPTSVDGYASGEMAGPNDEWEVAITGTAGAAGAGTGEIDVEADIETSDSVHSKRDATYQLSIDEPSLTVGTFSVDLLIFPIDFEIVGLTGAVLVERAVEEE